MTDPAVAVPQDEPKPYNPQWRVDPNICAMVEHIDSALIFDTLLFYTRSNERQTNRDYQLSDGRFSVRVSRQQLTKAYKWLTLRQVDFRIADLVKVGLIERTPVENGEVPRYVIATRYYVTYCDSDLPDAAKRKGGGNVDVTLTSSNSSSESTKLIQNIPSFIPPILQATVSSDDEPEQAKADVVAHAPLTNEQPKPKATREDLPDLNNPRYAHHRRIAQDAFDRCGQTPGSQSIRQLMRTLSDCEDCWTLEDQERLLPKVIQAAFDRNKPIVSLSGFLRYSGRGGAANHPFGAALAGERPEPKPQAVHIPANRVSGWQGVMAVPHEPLKFNREAWLEENRIARAKHLNTRHITRKVAMSPDDKEAHSSSIRLQAQRMLDAVNGETIP